MIRAVKRAWRDTSLYSTPFVFKLHILWGIFQIVIFFGAVIAREWSFLGLYVLFAAFYGSSFFRLNEVAADMTREDHERIAHKMLETSDLVSRMKIYPLGIMGSHNYSTLRYEIQKQNDTYNDFDTRMIAGHIIRKRMKKNVSPTG